MVTGTRSPAVAGWSVRSGEPKDGEVESWKSYRVVPLTGVQEKAGFWLWMVEPLAGEEITGTAAAIAWMVNDCIGVHWLVTGVVVFILQ
jgi:hypothetical protein